MWRASLLVLGTNNRKKRDELAALLAPLGIELKTLSEYPQAIEVVEDGASFAENAAKKASQQASHLGQWVLGEDSGICVDALGGAPGVLSARYSGPNATDESNNQKLLDAIHDVAAENRAAHYVCHLALADNNGEIQFTCEEICRGRIVRQPRGSAGFGYDPLFEIIECHHTFGELGEAVKAAISHRGRATRKLAMWLASRAPAGVRDIPERIEKAGRT